MERLTLIAEESFSRGRKSFLPLASDRPARPKATNEAEVSFIVYIKKDMGLKNVVKISEA